MKPPRPFGLTLAIVMAWILFTLIPFLVTGLVFFINNHVYRDAATGGMSGVKLTNFQVLPFAAVIAAAVLMGFIGWFTWLGRPAFMRIIFPSVVLFYTVVTFAGVLLPLMTASPMLVEGADSGQQVFEVVFSGYTGIAGVSAVYTLWFCNRWSVRAFFRGYYTEKDKRVMEALGIEPHIIQQAGL